MVLKPEPLFAAVEAIRERRGPVRDVVLTSPAGRRFVQADARRLASVGHFVVLCGRYEGVDDRVRAHLASEEVSIGDYVLSGGEPAALVMVDAITRLLPGALGSNTSAENESFSDGLLDYPHYTRPAEFMGMEVPQVLQGGNHSEIEKWRKEKALEKTRSNRPDLLKGKADVDGSTSPPDRENE